MSFIYYIHNVLCIGSSYLHFIIAATTLEEEYLSNLQIISILHLFPTASIDLYVHDIIWYIRHHYSFFSTMKVKYVIS